MKKILSLLIVLLNFSNQSFAQCTVTGSPNVNSNTITCSSFSGCSTIYIGNGINPTNLVMNNNLDLSCYGAIQFVVRNNTTIDFSSGNYNLTLAAGSSIVVEEGGNISSVSNCSASDLIKIGTIKVASCNGSGGAIMDFPTLVSGGGYNVVIASATAVCSSGTSVITASQNPAPTSSTTFRFYTVASGGTPVHTTTVSASPYTVTYTTPTISATTTYYVEAVSGGSTTPRKAVTVTVNPLPATPAVTATHPTCTVTTGSVTVNSPSGTGMTYSINGSAYSNTSGIFTNLVPGTYTITAKSVAGCISPVRTVTINAQPLTPVQPTLGNVTQPTCTLASGTFTITNYNASYTYTITPSAGVSRSGATVSAPSGSYTVTATSGACTSIASSPIVISSQPTNTWNGSVWSNGTPTQAQKLVFSGDFSSSANITGCTCTVTSGAVVINSGHTLTISNEIDVHPGGSLTFENTASLVQLDDAAVNTGNITYKRVTRSVTRWAYVYWGSPVEQNVYGQIPSQFDLAYKWLSGSMDGLWSSFNSTSVGEGFITRVRNIAPFNTGNGTVNFSFVGKPNNGVINVNVNSYDSASLVSGNTALLANPYPSAIDAAKFLQHPNNTELGGTLFFWTAVTHYAGSGPYNIQDYGSWNLTGGTAPVSNAALVPSGKIAAGQGFFSQIFADGTISFNNAMRETGNNTQFFRTANVTETSEEIERHRIWLNLSGTNTLRQTLLGYISGATDSFDRMYDGDSFTSNEIDVYSLLDNRKLVIQGRALPFNTNDVVPIGYRVTTAGNYSLNMAITDGIFAGEQDVYLLDKSTGVYHDLKASAYSFTSAVGTFNDRFEIRFTNQALGVNNPTVADAEVKVVSNTAGVAVYCSAVTIAKVEIFDVLGKLLYQNNAVDSNALEGINLQNTKVLLVKVTLDNGMTYTKKTLVP
ncbi:hypothetical protein [Flavobacterium sp.]|uniref:Ig-like domain-containing protein n=1 Tax=Flavobacterium sp. TaxID=239 RepID=UPI0025F0F507|nr:hypothetical protein [Flavobacterium sp.]